MSHEPTTAQAPPPAPSGSAASPSTRAPHVAVKSALVGQPFALQMSMLAPRDGGAVQREASLRGAFSGPPREVPERRAQEASFGSDFSDVQAYTGPAAAGACEALGADALALGKRVAFREERPSHATVAHELTHVLEQDGAPAGALRGKGADAAQLDTAHEGTAEAVEAAVSGGGRAQDVIAERGLGAGPDGVQLMQSSFSLSGALPATVGINSKDQLTGEANTLELWPRTTLLSTPIYAPPPVSFQVVTQGHLQRIGRVPKTLDTSTAPYELGARVRADLNFQLAGGVPGVAELYGGAGGRAQVASSVRIGPGDDWRIAGGDLSLNAALIIGATAGPLRVEWRALDAEIVRGNLYEITPRGFGGLTLTWGKDIKLLAEFIEELIALAGRIGAALTAPLQLVVLAGQSLETLDKVKEVLGCVGDSVLLGVFDNIANQSYEALWDEAMALTMLGPGSARATGKSASARRAIDTILGTLHDRYLDGHSFRRTRPSPDDAVALIAWHQRIQSELVGADHDVAQALAELGMSHLGGMRLIEFMWAMQRQGLVSFGADPNQVADQRHGPLITQLKDEMAEAAKAHAQCGAPPHA